MGLWRARCVATRMAGSEVRAGETAVREGGTAPRLDPTAPCWRGTGLRPGWPAPATPEQLPGRPKTDRLDAVWLC
jgi:hypothetical protein